jgi:hypothetical protein
MAALGAVGLSTSMAQVYSVNAVGFVTVTIPSGFYIVANPLKAATNTIPVLFAGVPESFTVYKYGATGYLINTFELGVWSDDTMTLVPGEGAWVLNPNTNDLKITFVGEVSQGALTHSIPKGFSLQSSEVPQAATLDTLKFPVAEGDTAYRYNRGGVKGYTILTYELGQWSDTPTIEVGEGFWVSKGAATAWARSFDVNNP